MSVEFTVIDAPQTVIGEGPMWSVRDQVLYWIDVVSRRIFRLRPETGRVDVRDLPRDALRARIGYVEQSAPVLAGTLRENLLISAP